MIERELDVTTPEGQMKTFVYHPTHDGPHPVVLYLMDAPSIRPALKDMAMRLSSAGYYVLLPYLFYRGGPFREFGMSDEDMHTRRELMGAVTPTNIVSDCQALLDFAATDPAAQVGGKVRSVRVRPWGEVLTFEVVLADTTGAITIAFGGRRSVAARGCSPAGTRPTS